jgi:serine/threonine protein kinase
MAAEDASQTVDVEPEAAATPTPPPASKVDLDSRFHWGRLLGRGSYADVVLVHTLEERPAPFAMKIIDKRLIKSNHQLQELLREIRIMRRVRHPGIVRLEEVFETERKVYLQMEYVSGGELFDRIAEREHFSERDARDIVWQIVDALLYLHRMGVVHRDLKPENILTLASPDKPPSPAPASIVNDLSTLAGSSLSPPSPPPPPAIPLPYPHQPGLIVKLADFGLATTLGFPPSFAAHPLKTQCGSFPYVAPEVLVGSEHRGYGYEVDVWSLGVIAYVLLSGHFPFRPEAYSSRDPNAHVDGDPHAPRPESTRRMLDRIMEGGWKRAMEGEGWEGVSKEGKEWVAKCLEIDTANRWDAQMAHDAPWFRIKLDGDEEGEPSAATLSRKKTETSEDWKHIVDRVGEALGGKAHLDSGSGKGTPAPSVSPVPPASEPTRPSSPAPSATKRAHPLQISTAALSTTTHKLGEWWHHFLHGDEEPTTTDLSDGTPQPPPVPINVRKLTSTDLHAKDHPHSNSWNPKHLVHRIRAHAWERRKVKEERMKDAVEDKDADA